MSLVYRGEEQDQTKDEKMGEEGEERTGGGEGGNGDKTDENEFSDTSK